MLLTIHNLPSSTTYSDLKKLIYNKCGLTEIILDHLVNDGGTKKVTIGLADEEDAAILVRKINGIYLNGQPVYVEDVRKKKPTDQPYRPTAASAEYISYTQAMTNASNVMPSNQYQPMVMGQQQMIQNYTPMGGMQYNIPSNMNSASISYYGPNETFTSQQPQYSERSNMPNIGYQTQRNEEIYESSPNISGQRSEFPRVQGRVSQFKNTYNTLQTKENINMVRDNEWRDRPSLLESWNATGQGSNQNIKPEHFKQQGTFASGQRIGNQYESKVIKDQSRPFDQQPMHDSSPRRLRDEQYFQGQHSPNPIFERNFKRPQSREEPLQQKQHQPRSDAERGRASRANNDFRRREDFRQDSRSSNTSRNGASLGQISRVDNNYRSGVDIDKNSGPDRNLRYDAGFDRSSGGDNNFEPTSSFVKGSGLDKSLRKTRFDQSSKLENKFGNDNNFNSGSRANRSSGSGTSFDQGPRVNYRPEGGESHRKDRRGDSVEKSAGFDRGSMTFKKSGFVGDRFKILRITPSQNTKINTPFYGKSEQNSNKFPVYSGGNESIEGQKDQSTVNLKTDGSMSRKRPYYDDSNKSQVSRKKKSFVESSKKKESAKMSSKVMIRKDETWRSQAASMLAKEIAKKFGIEFGDPVFKPLKLSIRSRIDVILIDHFALSVDVIVKLYRKKFQYNGDKKFFEMIQREVQSGNTEKFYHDISVGQNADKHNVQKPSEGAETATNNQEPNTPEGASKKEGNISVQPDIPTELPSHLSAKAMGKEQKKIAKLEFGGDTIYTLPDGLQEPLDKELETLYNMFINECQDPSDEKEEIVCKKMIEQCAVDFKKVVDVHIVKRILNIKTGLVMRTTSRPKPPKKAALEAFLTQYGGINVKKSDRRKTFIINVDSYENYDKLYSLGTVVIDEKNVTFEPIHIVGPPPRLTKQEIKRNRENWIKRQIDTSDVTIGNTNTNTDECPFEKVVVKDELKEADNDEKSLNTAEVKEEDSKINNATKVKEEAPKTKEDDVKSNENVDVDHIMMKAEEDDFVDY